MRGTTQRRTAATRVGRVAPVRRRFQATSHGYDATVPDALSVLLRWESNETHSWNPILADLLREEGDRVTEVHDLHSLEALDLSEFDVCLPRFRVGAAHMSCWTSCSSPRVSRC